MNSTRVWVPVERLIGDVWDGVTDQYGPRSHAVVSAMEVLMNVEWAANRGAPAPAGAPAHRALRSWSEVVEEIQEGRNGQIDRFGNVAIPATRVWKALDADPAAREWHRRILEECEESITVSAVRRIVPDASQADCVEDYVGHYVRLLAAEIVLGERCGSTHFTALLPWFAAGHLPAGWDGKWPTGVTGVF